MQQPSSSENNSHPDWVPRLNRAFGDVNAFLIALAIGLAVLDGTCFLASTAITEISRAQFRTGQAGSSHSASWQDGVQSRHALVNLAVGPVDLP